MKASFALISFALVAMAVGCDSKHKQQAPLVPNTVVVGDWVEDRSHVPTGRFQAAKPATADLRRLTISPDNTFKMIFSSSGKAKADAKAVTGTWKIVGQYTYFTIDNNGLDEANKPFAPRQTAGTDRPEGSTEQASSIQIVDQGDTIAVFNKAQ